MKKKPVILVTSEQGFNPANAVTLRHSPLFLLDKAYAHSVTAAGGIPITPLETYAEDQYTALADGLLLTGGSSEIHPGRYKTPFIDEKAALDVNIFRDQLEFDLFEAFFKAGKPILGIGRGNLLINVALGGTLIQDLAAAGLSGHAGGGLHAVSAASGSILEKLYGSRFDANTFHRQGVDIPGSGLKVTARSADGVPEALEHETSPVFSVQFNPERVSGNGAEPDKEPDGIFEYFVGLCRH